MRCVPVILAFHLADIACLDRLVTVERVAPGGEPRGDCEFWYDQEYDRRYNTFIDSFTEPPPVDRSLVDAGAQRVRPCWLKT